MKLKRLKLKKWLESEKLKEKIIGGIAKNEQVDHLIFEYVQLTTGKKVHKRRWQIVAHFFVLGLGENTPKLDFAIFKHSKEDKKGLEMEDPWEYEQRTWYLWSFLLARNFGWTIEYIENLDVDDAIAYIQEIALMEQQERDFQWGMAEVAYPYNEATKKQEFKPLDRPKWMTPVASEASLQPKKIKLHKKFMPVGAVVKYNENKIENKEA